MQQVQNPGDYESYLKSFPEDPNMDPIFKKIHTPKTKEEFDALPDGVFYIEPEDGHIYEKGNKKRVPKPKPPKGMEV